jgi:putative transposase
MKFEFMEEHRLLFPVQKMAKVLCVSKSGFYAWIKRPESRYAKGDRELRQAIRQIFEASDGIYGSPKITKELREQGRKVSRKRVARHMRQTGLRSKVQRRFRVTTTDSRHKHPIAPNLLNRNFTVTSPNKVWVSDITYVKVGGQWLYLAVFIDLFSRLVVGWALKDTLEASLVTKALSNAMCRRKPPPGLMIHSDRGIQYACEEFRAVLRAHEFVQSMSRKGNCWDNAVAESFFHVIKSECINHVFLDSKEDAMHTIFKYIEIFYNRKRRHGSIGFVAPDKFETMKAVA